ncbi:MAG: DMT family transporter [Clostridiales bacterium]|nr:DMT family transporter [Clostridiales bacterium]
MKIKGSFHIYAIIAIVFWSLAYVFTRLALKYFSPYSLGFSRYLVASGTLIIFVIKAKMGPPKKSDYGWFIIGGAIGFFLYMIAFNKGSETITASTSSVIISTAPILTALLANLFYKERLKIYQWAAIFISFLGVIVLTILNGKFMIGGGMVWIFFASVLVSLYNILQRKLTKTYSALQSTAYCIFMGTIMLSVFLPVTLGEVKSAPAIQIFYIVILGVFSSAIAYLAWAQALAKAKYTSYVSNYMFATPFLTTLLGLIIAKEIPDFSAIIGGAIILAGLFVFNFGGKWGQKPIKKPGS